MSIKNHSVSYRRGVLLGLTMAEIFILIIFLLLLIFSSLLSKEQKKYEEMEKKIVLVEKNKEIVDRIVQIIDADPDITKELVSIVEGFPEIVKQIEENALKENEENTQQVLARAIDKLKIEKEFESSNVNKTPEDQLKALLEEKKSLENELSNIKGQNQNLVSQMEGKGRSVEPPPCWPDSNGRWKDSIFKVDLTNEGITIYDNAPPARANQKASLPLQNIKYGTLRTVSQFQAETRALFDWSLANKCRFLVLTYDNTGENEKLRYKHLREDIVRGFFIDREIKLSQKATRPATSTEKKGEEQDENEDNEGSSFFGRIFKKPEDKSSGSGGYN